MIKSSLRFATPLLALLMPLSVFAGDAQYSNDKQPTVNQAVVQANTQNLFYDDTTYVFGSGFHKGKGTFGVQDAVDNAVQIGHRFLLSGLKWPDEGGQWFFRLGASYDRSDFSTTKAPVPDVLQNFNGEVALEYIVDNNQALFIQSHPGFYFENHVTASAFDAPTDIGGGFTIIKDKVYGFIGASGSILRTNIPVFPFGGVVWTINPKWVLRALFPQPRLVYNATNDLALWVGGNLTGGSYKTDDRSGIEPARLSGAVVNYYEYRAGVGFNYNVKPVTFEAGAGYDFTRQFDFPRADLTYSTKGAPYVSLSAHLDF